MEVSGNTGDYAEASVSRVLAGQRQVCRAPNSDGGFPAGCDFCHLRLWATNDEQYAPDGYHYYLESNPEGDFFVDMP
jgi:hypothetical protein